MKSASQDNPDIKILQQVQGAEKAIADNFEVSSDLKASLCLSGCLQTERPQISAMRHASGSEDDQVLEITC
jgi:hypothetical protein